MSRRDESEGAGLNEFGETDRILSVDLEETDETPPPELDQERRIAVFDLVEESRFALSGSAAIAQTAGGPYRLRLGADGDILRLTVASAENAPLAEIKEPMGEIREAVVDYVALCDDYRAGVRKLAPSQIEKIDEARREAHLEGAEALAEALAPTVKMDDQTARRFFTVLCAAIGRLDA